MVADYIRFIIGGVLGFRIFGDILKVSPCKSITVLHATVCFRLQLFFFKNETTGNARPYTPYSHDLPGQFCNPALSIVQCTCIWESFTLINILFTLGLSKLVFATYNNIEKWLQASDTQPGLNTEGDTNIFLDSFNASHLKQIGENSDGFPKENSGLNASESTKDKAVNTRVISASFVNRIRTQHVKLQEPVIFMMKHISVPVLIVYLYPSCYKLNPKCKVI